MEKIVILTCALLGCLPIVHGHANGAPEGACRDMFPKHYGLVAQTSKAPYTITVTPNSYQPGSMVTVQVHSNTDKGFKGFLLQARKASCTSTNFEVPVGMFQISDSQIQLMTCPRGNTSNSVTHTSSEKKQSKTFSWMNMDEEGGDVFFQATVVQSYNTVWTGVKSEVVKDSRKSHAGRYPDCPVKNKDDMHPQVSLANPVASLNVAFLLFAAVVIRL